jgi:hypothetical protein
MWISEPSDIGGDILYETLMSNPKLFYNCAEHGEKEKSNQED